MRILLTGANGQIGSTLVAHLRERHQLVAAVFDLDRPDAPPPLAGEGVLRLDIRDLEAVRAAVEGMDAVIHLAGERRVSASWEDLVGPNILGVRNVMEAAALAGVGKFVFASSNHVTGGYDERQAWPIDADQPIWPDSCYGVTKVFGEAVGRLMSDRFGMSVICLRIGWAVPRPTREIGLRMWISPDDLRHLIDCCLEAQVPYGVYYGVSANTRLHWDLSRAAREIGYRPKDDAEAFLEELRAAGVDVEGPGR